MLGIYSTVISLFMVLITQSHRFVYILYSNWIYNPFDIVFIYSMYSAELVAVSLFTL